MRRLIGWIAVFVLCFSMACPAQAAEFVPSAGYKDHPNVDGPIKLVDEDGNVVDDVDDGCLVITSVAEAEDSDEIPEDAKKELLDVYQKLTDGTMTLPYVDDQEYVIRDLIDISLICDDGHKEKLEEEGVYLELTFELGVVPGIEVVVMVYIDGQWVAVPGVTNNGDGTVTVLFEDICPVTFSVPVESHNPPAQTGDTSGILIWTAVLVVSAAALVVLLISRRKAAR